MPSEANTRLRRRHTESHWRSVPSETTNPDQLIVVTNDGTLGAPYYLGPVQCGRAHWEHNLRELLEMDDPCFPNPFRDDLGSIRSFL